MVPRIAAQIPELQEQLPQSWARFQNYLRELPFSGAMLSGAEGQDFLQSGDLRSWGSQVFSVTFSGLVKLLFVVVTGIYLAVKPQTYIAGVLKLVPVRSRDRACQVMGAVGYTLEWWLIGQLTVMILVTVVTASGLALLGIPLALTLGVIAGLLEFIPNVGPIVAAIPAVLIAFLSGPQTALYVMIFFLAIQQLESYILTPLVQRRAVSLEPALIITAQLAFATTVGALGMLLATPLAAGLLVAVKMLYVEDVLGDRVEVEGTDRVEDSCAVDPR
jgi:predicted PurR-regulated permease PerM